MNTISLMREIDYQYRAQSGLTDSRFDKIFYSRIDPAPVLVLGINPAGSPDRPGAIVSASNGYFENYEHDYVDCDYAIQRVMFPFLKNVLGATADEIRQIPKTNLAFRRSPDEDHFKQYHSMTLSAAMVEAKPSLLKIIGNVQPKLILLETMKPEKFAKLYAGRVIGEQVCESIKALHRGQMVRAFEARLMPIECLGRSIPVVAIGHPSSSSFSREHIWTSIRQSARSVCIQSGAVFR